MKEKFSRRHFLKNAGLAATFLPMLEPELVQACAFGGPKRAVFVLWANGTSEWVSGGGNSFSLPGTMASLEPFKHKLLPISGVRYQNLKDSGTNGGHASSSAMLTGKKYGRYVDHGPQSAGGPSIDQFIANHYVAQNPNYRTGIHLAALHQRDDTVYRDFDQPVKPFNNPFLAFDSLFSSNAFDDALDLTSEEDKINAAKRSVLDKVINDLNRFKNRVGYTDRIRIEAHLTSIRELEKNLVQSYIGCGGVNIPNRPAEFNWQSTVSYPETTRFQMEIMAIAMAADLSRTGVITLGDCCNDHVVLSWLDYTTGYKGGDLFGGSIDAHHTIAHEGGERKRQVDKWFMEQFAFMLEKFDNVDEGGTTLLDNSVVSFINNMATGGGHQVDGVKWLLAGSCSGYFKQGYYADTDNAIHSRVLCEISRAMDVEPTEQFVSSNYAGEMSNLRA